MKGQVTFIGWAEERPSIPLYNRFCSRKFMIRYVASEMLSDRLINLDSHVPSCRLISAEHTPATPCACASPTAIGGSSSRRTVFNVDTTDRITDPFSSQKTCWVALLGSIDMLDVKETSTTNVFSLASCGHHPRIRFPSRAHILSSPWLSLHRSGCRFHLVSDSDKSHLYPARLLSLKPLLIIPLAPSGIFGCHIDSL